MSDNLEFAVTITYAGRTYSVVTEIVPADLRLPMDQCIQKIMRPIMTRFLNWVNYTGTTPMASSSPKHRLRRIPPNVTPTTGWR